MDVFLSWSGDRSRYLALTFKEWLPNVLQFVEPYFSQRDIQLGERWSNNIEETLSKHDFGLVFVTPENINSTWVNFEAGALSKNLKSRLVPMLWDAEITLLNEGPLKQFQSSKEFTRENILDLVTLLNNSESEERSLSPDRLEASFNKWWGDLESKLRDVPQPKEQITKPTDDQMLEAILQQISKNNKILENNNLNQSSREKINPRVVNDLAKSVGYIENAMDKVKELTLGAIDETETLDLILEVLDDLEKARALNRHPVSYLNKLININ